MSELLVQAAPAALFVARGLEALVVLAGVTQSVSYVWQLLLAAFVIARRPPVTETAILRRRYAAAAPRISILVPAHNEAATIITSVRSLLALDYPDFEVLVVDDGSTDATLGCLVEAFGLRERRGRTACGARRFGARAEGRLRVLSKLNGGKGDALNAGLAEADGELVCVIDADCVLEPDALLRAAQPFIDHPDEVVAVGATIRPVNGCRVTPEGRVEVDTPRNPLALLQTVEYLRAFMSARLAWSQLGALTLISGAFGLFRRDVLVEIGGYSTTTLGEDLELVVRLRRHLQDGHRQGRVVFIPEPLCWTEAPEDLAVLRRQRVRWQRGALETFAAHWPMLFHRRYGRIGLLGLGRILLVDVMGPILELAGWSLLLLFWALGALSTDHALAYLALAISFGVAISLFTLSLEEAELRRFPRTRSLVALAAAAVLENFGYRQLNTLWRIEGTLRHFTTPPSWGTMTRKGFAPAAA
ncbi:glycosyltransferase family 2 protein [Phenylobacterium sp.]|jgi:cellulose synthase/poly-beta-1,6-N-acetylglucosamine synthase-like glycosyltransferase|uniref:glycosyltransferase family 2 protein n=1 Tax=Phenylobacterium sp. TaxID=1871053 RepID=UPI002F935BA5